MPINPVTPSRSNESKVIELCGVFPDKKHSEVVNALESADGDLQSACAILLAEPNEIDGVTILEDNPNPLEELQVMFPEVDSNEIAAVYNRYQSVDRAITELLSLPLLRLEDGEEQKVAERQVQTRQFARPKGQEEEGTAWKSVPDKIKTIQQFTAVPDTLARQAFHESSFNAIKAIVKLVWTTESFGDGIPAADSVFNENANDSKPVTIKPKGGKVQSAAGFAHATKDDFNTLDNEPEITAPAISRGRTYVFTEDSKEAQELQEILRSNSTLRSINRAFLKRALTFYRGDMSMTMSLALLIIEADLSCATYKTEQSDLNLEEGFKMSSGSSKNSHLSSGRRDRPARTSSLTLQNDEHYSKGQQMIEHVFDSPRLDFHGFVPKDAIQVLKICLDRWWTQELSEREMNRQKLSISRALNVVPLEVVTGRGIHSAGGVSTLKIKVRAFLNNNNYLFSEESAYFVIEGKKK